MKKSLALSVVFLTFLFTSTDAQRRTSLVSFFNSYNSSYDYDYNDSRRLVRYRRDNYLFNQLSRNDRRRLIRLEEKLYDRAECAWDDGYISEKDRRRVREVERDINKLLRRYRDYYRSDNRYRNDRDQRRRNDRNRNQRDRRDSRPCWR